MSGILFRAVIYTTTKLCSNSALITTVKRFYPGKDKIVPIKVLHDFCGTPSNVRALISIRDLNIEKAMKTKVYRNYLKDVTEQIYTYYVSKEGFITKINGETLMPSILIPKVPVFIYDSSKIKEQLQTNYAVKKYIKEYDKAGFQLPYIMETFPIQGISGCMTFSELDRNLLIKKDVQFLQMISYTFTRYMITMYGGKPIKTIDDIIFRVKQLFVEDSLAFNYSYPQNHVHGIKALMPLMQHWLSIETLNLLLPKNSVKYPANFNVSGAISLQKYGEIQCVEKTHHFLNKDELLIIDSKNSSHLQLIKNHFNIISPIIKQPHPDVLGTAIVINTKTIYPLDIKLIGYPELYLQMLSSYSSLSPHYQGLVHAEKISGQLDVQITKLSKSNVNKNFFINQRNDLITIIKNHKKGALSLVDFKEQFNQWCITFFNLQISAGNFISENMSFLPSIIEAAHKQDLNNPYTIMQKENPHLIKSMVSEAKQTITFEQWFPTQKDYPKLDLYKIYLEFMVTLKKYNMLENYYALRKILLIEDVTHIV